MENMFEESKNTVFDYKKIDAADIAFFRETVGEAHVLTEGEHFATYAKDETENLRFYPEVVVKPNSTEEVSAVVGTVLRIAFRSIHGRLAVGSRPIASRCFAG